MNTDTTTRTPSTWGRWHWSDGLGRWHAIAALEGSTYKLACGRVRKPPQVTAGRPGAEKCCPTCAQLDDLRNAYSGEQVEEPELVAVGIPLKAPATAPAQEA